jgi:hypothetical protein
MLISYDEARIAENRKSGLTLKKQAGRAKLAEEVGCAGQCFH